MAIEKEEEESWKQEYEEIANFSKEAEEKFSKYKIVRLLLQYSCKINNCTGKTRLFRTSRS